jgi:CRISPR/Cas system-associated exonuclease Cas4 (RecB family)
MLRSERIKVRKKRLLKDFNNLRNVYIRKVKKYRAEAVIEMLSEKYFLSPQTVSDIVYKIGTYAKDIYKQD